MSPEETKCPDCGSKFYQLHQIKLRYYYLCLDCGFSQEWESPEQRFVELLEKGAQKPPEHISHFLKGCLIPILITIAITTLIIFFP